MGNKDFAVFILTHGRPDNVKTLSTLKKCGYTGNVYFIVDNEDKTIDTYIKNFGSEFVKVFDKKAIADEVDEGNNFDERRTITHARNACFKIAKEIGITYFVQLDDDYYYFGYRYDTGAKIITNMDKVFEIMLNFYKSVNIKSIAFGQGGDHIGGFSGIKLKRIFTINLITLQQNIFIQTPSTSNRLIEIRNFNNILFEVRIQLPIFEIGRASCRERVLRLV